MTTILDPVVVHLTWYCPSTPLQTLFVPIAQLFVADRLSPSSVTAASAPPSATVSALLHSSDRLDWRSDDEPASRETARSTIMIAISSMEITSE